MWTCPRLGVPGIVLIAFACWLAEPSGALPIESQVWRDWSDVRSLSRWEDAFVQLLAPGAEANSSTLVPAKTIAIRTHAAPREDGFGVVAFSNPGTGDVYVMRGAQVIVQQRGTGVTSVLQRPQVVLVAGGTPWTIELTLGSLNVFASYVRVSAAAGMAAALSEFSAKFSIENREAFHVISKVVRLATSAPSDFFSRDGIPMWPSSQMIDVDDGQLRIVLANYLGRSGTFWVDTNTWMVTRSDFGSRN